MLGHPSDTSLEVESPDKDDEEECSSDWEPLRRAVDLTWRDEVTPILESFTRRTPGSALETTDARLCWYFRDADPDFGIQQARSRRPAVLSRHRRFPTQAKNLQLHLEVVVEHRPVRVVMSSLKKSVVVQPARVSPGRALRGAIPNFDAYDLILAVGDEVYSEEDVFELFEASPHSFSVTVGRRLSRASFFLDEEEVLPTLQTLAAVTNEAFGTPVSSAQTLPRTSSLDLGASRMPDSPPTLTASFRPVDSPTFPSFEEVSPTEDSKVVDDAGLVVENQSLNS